MEPTLHLKQGLTLLEKVLKFYPLVREGEAAEVSLTQQDWLVLLDFVHNPGSDELLPSDVKEMTASIDDRAIYVQTEDCRVKVVIGM